jgi:hypothetical protein
MWKERIVTDIDLLSQHLAGRKIMKTLIIDNRHSSQNMNPGSHGRQSKSAAKSTASFGKIHFRFIFHSLSPSLSCCSRFGAYGIREMFFFSLQFLNTRTVGRTPWTGDQPFARPLPTETQNKRRHTPTPWVGFEPTIPVFERAKTVHALTRAATVIGYLPLCLIKSRTSVDCLYPGEVTLKQFLIFWRFRTPKLRGMFDRRFFLIHNKKFVTNKTSMQLSFYKPIYTLRFFSYFCDQFFSSEATSL